MGLTFNPFTGQLDFTGMEQTAADTRYARLASANIFSVNGAASTPAMSLTGSVFTGGSGTTTKPLFLIEPTGTTSTGWNTFGTMLGVNAPSGFSNGSLIDLQIAGTSYFKVLPDTLASGAVEIYLAGNRLVMYNGRFNPNFSTISLGDSSDVNRQWAGLVVRDTSQVMWSSDTGLARGAAATVKATDGGLGYGRVDAAGYSVLGTPGVSAGPYTVITSLTVTNGIITGLTGS